jgi:hypothetical protein
MSKQFPGTVPLLVGALDAPEKFAPAVNVYTVDELPWAQHMGSLPRHERLAGETAARRP